MRRYYASNQETRHIHRQAVWLAFRRHILHQPLRADDAVCVEIHRHPHRQRPHPRRHGTVFLVHGADDGAAGSPPGHPALLAHHLRQPGRVERAHRHQGSRHLTDADAAPPHRLRHPHRHRLVLFPERPGSARQQEDGAAAHLYEAEEPRVGNTGGHLLRRTAAVQPLRATQGHGDGQALRHHDIPHDRQLRGRRHHPGRLGHAAVDRREEAPAAHPLQRRVV